MKLVQQIQLHYRDEKSDKLYEVDLCEVGPDQFLVNFRYGRRGRALKSGTRTDFPVGEAEARTIFQKLVDSKIKKGYRASIQEATDRPQAAAADTAGAPPAERLRPAHRAALLSKLQALFTALPQALKETPSPSVTTDPESGEGPRAVTRDNSVWNIFRRLTGGNARDKDTPSSNIPRFNSSKDPNSREKRSLSRLVWRMGELHFADGVPFLLKIASTFDPQLTYSLVWALGRCGDARALPKLLEIEANCTPDSALYHLVQEAKLALLDGPERETFLRRVHDQLPLAYRDALRTDDAEAAIRSAIEDELTNAKQAYHSIAQLYLLASGQATVHRALLRWCGEVSFRGGGYFKSLRQLYKAAEFRNDFRLLGTLAYQIEKQPSFFDHSPYRGLRLDGQWVRIAQEIKHPQSRVGFSRQTKAYLTRRTWRNLYRKGQVGDPNYVPLAVAILLSFSDADEKNTFSTTRYEYGRDANGNWYSNAIKTFFSPFASWSVFNEILYRNSPRYRRANGRHQWIYRDSHTALSPLPAEREEAFPELWDRQVAGLLHLLAESRSRVVHEFAVKAARANLAAVLPLIDADFLSLLLSKEYKVSTQFGLELARQWYRADEPSIPLLQALLRCSLAEARQQGMEWVDDQKERFFQAADFIAPLLFSPWETVSEWLDHSLTALTLPETVQTTTIARAIGRMNEADQQSDATERRCLLQAGQLLEKHFPSLLYHASFQLVQHLLSHPLAEVQNFGARILLHHQSPPESWPDGLLLGLINGSIPDLRRTGVELLNRFSDESLFGQLDLIVGLCLSPHAEVRRAVLPLVDRLIRREARVGDTLCGELAPHLLRKENAPGRDADLIELLTVRLGTYLGSIGRQRALQLLFAPRKAAHAVGQHYLQHFADGSELTLRQIVKLGDNEMRAVREWVWQYYREQRERMITELGEAVRLMDAKWADSRDFAFDYFRREPTEEDWTPEIVVSICDSVQPAVQQFGQEMITRYFKRENGEQYLLQLSQHPSPSLQQFASNYLERFAADRPEHIEQLRHYFYAVLAGVNKSRVAKKRIFAFLQQEALKSQRSARLVAEVIGRQSATFSIEDKARCIQILLDLRQHFPDLDLPLRIHDYAPYAGRTEISNP